GKDPGGVHRQAKAALEEVYLRQTVFRHIVRIAVDGVGGARLERLDDRRGAGKVHIRHPEGDDVFAAENFLPAVPFFAGRARAVDDGVEICPVYSHAFPSVLVIGRYFSYYTSEWRNMQHNIF